jgi:hypothetical protein
MFVFFRHTTVPQAKATQFRSKILFKKCYLFYNYILIRYIVSTYIFTVVILPEIHDHCLLFEVILLSYTQQFLFEYLNTIIQINEDPISNYYFLSKGIGNKLLNTGFFNYCILEKT